MWSSIGGFSPPSSGNARSYRPIGQNPTHRYLRAAEDRLAGDGEPYTAAMRLDTVEEALRRDLLLLWFPARALSSRKRAGAKSRVALLRLLIAARMEPKAGELFPHGDTGDAKPAGGLGLVTLGELDRLGE
jgi:hypothetical protein